MKYTWLLIYVAVLIWSAINPEAFLGTQGYMWDTQSDMALALLGAVMALIFLATVHNMQLLTLLSLPVDKNKAASET